MIGHDVFIYIYVHSQTDMICLHEESEILLLRSYILPISINPHTYIPSLVKNAVHLLFSQPNQIPQYIESTDQLQFNLIANYYSINHHIQYSSTIEEAADVTPATKNNING